MPTLSTLARTLARAAIYGTMGIAGIALITWMQASPIARLAWGDFLRHPMASYRLTSSCANCGAKKWQLATPLQPCPDCFGALYCGEECRAEHEWEHKTPCYERNMRFARVVMGDEVFEQWREEMEREAGVD